MIVEPQASPCSSTTSWGWRIVFGGSGRRQDAALTPQSFTGFPSGKQGHRVTSKSHPSTATRAVTPALSIAASIEQATQPLKIAFVSAEVAPWSKTGGLGDVVGGLPIELARRGHEVVSIAPRYDQHWDAWDTSVTATIGGEEVRYFHTVKDGVNRIWVDHPWFLSKVWGKTGSKLYGSKSGSDYADNQKRFLLFSKAALKALEVLPFGPGVDSLVVANDWHTAILPVLVKEVYQKNGQYTSMKTALCIHNIAFQGRFWAEDWKALDLPDRMQSLFEFEDGYPRVFSETEPDEDVVAAPGQTFRKLNWLKAGILTADKLLTVSPNYATEIAEDDEKGVELANIIREAGGLEGIVNGCDVGEWSPFLDKHLDVKYDAQSMEEGKAIAKETLQAELGLAVDPNIPVFGFIGRLEEQKGVDILIDALPAVAREGAAQIVVLGTGKKALEAAVLKLDKAFPDTVKGVVKFNVPLAHLIIAGADYMLVPSRFEPCGLIQLHAMNYGTVPVVGSTGGLVDTVKDSVTGFHAGRFNPDRLDSKDSEALAATIKRAIAAFHTPAFRTMQERCIVQELSWEKPAEKWEAVLTELWTAPHKATTRPRSAQRDARSQRSSSFLTPVQEVNREGDPVPKDAIARKSAATLTVIEQNKPKGTGTADRAAAPAATGTSPRSPTCFSPPQKLADGSSAAPSGRPVAEGGGKAVDQAGVVKNAPSKQSGEESKPAPAKKAALGDKKRTNGASPAQKSAAKGTGKAPQAQKATDAPRKGPAKKATARRTSDRVQ